MIRNFMMAIFNINTGNYTYTYFENKEEIEEYKKLISDFDYLKIVKIYKLTEMEG